MFDAQKRSLIKLTNFILFVTILPKSVTTFAFKILQSPKLKQKFQHER
jgi:hypothetical protein